MSKQQRYTEEFRQEAVKLVTQAGYSQSEAGKSLGVSSKNISRWIKEAAKGAPSVAKTSLTAEQVELILQQFYRQIKGKHLAVGSIFFHTLRA
jgi:transposase